MNELTPLAKEFLQYLSEIYKNTGKNEFPYSTYFQFSNHAHAIDELLEKGYLNKKENIQGTISIVFED
ncbi:hypothetical protein [Blautia hydrogenotrophica]|uniref:hypothetical protein n=1 Tax=Blautia hydrogenotrophica TaxID=53443 RepID=UPI002942CD0F|nr:hypothetical protein [Blautia hydrogenotrophica]